MSKVFVVTVGDYSDYHIEMMFPTRALADEWVLRRAEADDCWGEPEIEEWELTEQIGDPVEVLTVQAYLRDGVWDDPTESISRNFLSSDYPRVDAHWKFTKPTVLWLQVYGTHHTAVRKSFTERRARLLADWPVLAEQERIKLIRDQNERIREAAAKSQWLTNEAARQAAEESE